MKYEFSILTMLVAAAMLSCNELPVGQTPVDSVPPGTVSNITSKNTPGGAILYYELPDDEDLLYVKAVYDRVPGEPSMTISSFYIDSIVIEGFADTEPKRIGLVAVDRSQNESEAVYTTVEPLTPLVSIIGKTLTLAEAVGGVELTWENPLRSPISVVVMMRDSNGDMSEIETLYSTVAQGYGAVRGLEEAEAEFAVYVKDHWGNRSEILYETLTPLFEDVFDNHLFQASFCDNDERAAWGWVMERMWDGIRDGDGNGFHTENGTGRWPHSFTIDLGVLGKISRIKLWQRGESYLFAHGNPRKFEVWGAETLDPTGDWNSYIKIGDCVSVKPSGLPAGQVSNEDRQYAMAGEEFIMGNTRNPIRYVRFRITEAWGGGDFVHICELEFYGDNRH